jgi:hypothetical protein
VFLDDVDTLDHHARRTDKRQHDTALAFVLAGDDDNFVAFTNSFHLYLYPN